MSAAVAIRRAPDAGGFHRPPVSSCCRSVLVRLHPTVHRYVQAWDDDLAGSDLRCARCNRPIA